jgi:lipoprotein-anchoring transpeptidase ErfK/SrfK
VVRTARFSLLGLACVAGVFAAVLLGAPAAGADDGTTTTPTAPTTPTDTTPTTPTEPPPTTPAEPRTIVEGVTVAGQVVGGLTGAEARAAVERRFRRSFPLVISKSWSQRVTPLQLGARARVGKAVDAALRARTPGASIPLTIEVDDGVLRRYLSRLGRETQRDPRESRLRLVKLAPVWTTSVPGRRLKEVVAFYDLRLALRKHAREPFALPFDEVPPAVSEDSPGKVIVIRRESKELRLYNGTELKRVFRVATGQSSYPTPLGRWEIVNLQRNPWWYPPQTSAWAKGKEPVPPGPGNPLGTRWMGISAPLVGIHGTPDAASIGYSASHGCVRMLIPQVEWLFERVEIGTPVFIVPA